MKVRHLFGIVILCIGTAFITGGVFEHSGAGVAFGVVLLAIGFAFHSVEIDE